MRGTQRKNHMRESERERQGERQRQTGTEKERERASERASGRADQMSQALQPCNERLGIVGMCRSQGSVLKDRNLISC